MMNKQLLPAGCKRAITVLMLCVGLVLSCATVSLAVDEENCLFCHQYRGLSYMQKDGKFRLLYVTQDLYLNSPHGVLKCSGCHTNIKKFPHGEPMKVNCVTMCHLDEPSSGLPFSHQKVGDFLASSVHSKRDADGNLKPHPEDYPECVTCHTDPLYRPLAFLKKEKPGLEDKTIARCAICHEEMDFLGKFYNHFTSRMQKLRPPIEVVEMCGSCHGDTEMMERHNLPNLVKSYMETYHGKAVFFDDESSAECTDCHVMPGKSIHEILSMTDQDSSTHSDNIYKTCSDIDCHPDSKMNLAGYKAHVVLVPEKNPVEFYVCVFFVFLTLGSFIPVMIFTVLDMARNVFPNFAFIKKVKK